MQYDRNAWIDAFSMHLSKLGVRAQPDLIEQMGAELYETQGTLDPIEVAQSEWDEWPPHDD